MEKHGGNDIHKMDTFWQHNRMPLTKDALQRRNYKEKQILKIYNDMLIKLQNNLHH